MRTAWIVPAETTAELHVLETDETGAMVREPLLVTALPAKWGDPQLFGSARDILWESGYQVLGEPKYVEGAYIIPVE